jgi:formate transporter
MEVYQKISNIGQLKCEQYFFKQFVSAILSGCFLAFGACCSIRVGGHIENSDLGYRRLVSGLFGLPIGLLLIVLCNTQLFTGNTAFYTIALYERKIKCWRILPSMTIIYIGNLAGSILFAYAIYAAEVLDDSPSIITLAESKISSNWPVAILKGVLCNWFVCLALWQSACQDSVSDKAVGMFLPIAGFVSLGLEHCVANMYIIPQGMILGANITIVDFILYNLLPVTLGNILAGVFLVGLTSGYIFHIKPDRESNHNPIYKPNHNPSHNLNLVGI